MLRTKLSSLFCALLLCGCCASAVPASAPNSAGFEQLVRFELKPEAAPEFIAAAIRSVHASRGEPGNVVMNMYADNEDPNVVYVYSRWVNPAAYKAHQGEPHTVSLQGVAKRSLRGAPTIVVLRPLE